MTEPSDYWIALCWDRVLAGPASGSPPWLFVLQEHAEQYAGQLRAQGIDAQARRWVAKVTEWHGASLIRHPNIPGPELDPRSLPAARADTPDETHNGATSGTVPPPPTLE